MNNLVNLNQIVIYYGKSICNFNGFCKKITENKFNNIKNQLVDKKYQSSTYSETNYYDNNKKYTIKTKDNITKYYLSELDQNPLIEDKYIQFNNKFSNINIFPTKFKYNNKIKKDINEYIINDSDDIVIQLNICYDMSGKHYECLAILTNINNINDFKKIFNN